MDYDHFLWKLGVVKEERVLEDLRLNTFQPVVHYAVCVPERMLPGTYVDSRRIFMVLVDWLAIDGLIRYRFSYHEYDRCLKMLVIPTLEDWARGYMEPKNSDNSYETWSYDVGYGRLQDVQMFAIQFVQHLQKNMRSFLIEYQEPEEDNTEY